MDENNRRRRQNEPQYNAADPRFNTDQSQGRGFAGSSSDRFRPAALSTSPSTSRSAGSGAPYSGYYQEGPSSFSTAIPTNTLSYQSNYPQDQRQQQTFGAYNPDMMYNVAQQSPQNNVYDSGQQFQTRQPAAMELLSNVAAPYFPNEPATAPSVPSLQHHPSSSSSTVYQHQHSPGDRSLLQQGYPGSIGIGGIPQPPGSEILDVGFQPQAGGPGMEEAYGAYQAAIKQIFTNVTQRHLMEASESLLQVSDWLLAHVADLGLTVDDVTLHAERIRLWNEFNWAWLTIFQTQKEMLEEGQRIQHPQTIVPVEYIDKMVKELIRMCDGIEKFGLVDYQYGVREEEIIMAIEECLNIQSPGGEGSSGNPGLGRAPP